MNSILDSKEFAKTKESILLCKDGKEEWKGDFIEFVNDDCDNSDLSFFFDMLPAVRFIMSTDPGTVAYTKPNKRIYLNAPYWELIKESKPLWESVYFHECLHQLWDTFGVGEQIKKELGEKMYNHQLLNIASDCVINEFIMNNLRRKLPSELITGATIKKEIGVEYDRAHDTQFTLYKKIMEHEKEAMEKLKNFMDEMDKQNQQGESQGGKGKQKGDPQSGKGSQQGDQQGGQGSQDDQQGGNSSGQSSNSKPIDKMTGDEAADAAQKAADAAQKAADAAQKAADKAKENVKNGNGSKSSADAAQKAADKAQEAADKAQDAADAAKDAADKGDDDTAREKAKEAASATREAANAAREAIKEANGNQKSNKNGKDNEGSERSKGSEDSEESKGSKNNNTGGDEVDSAIKDAENAADEIDGGDSEGKESTSSGKEEGTPSGQKQISHSTGPHTLEEFLELDEMDQEATDEIKKIVEEHKKRIDGVVGEFLEKTKQSIKDIKNIRDGKGYKTFAKSNGVSKWDLDFKKFVDDYIKKQIFKKKREMEDTYSRPNRRSGYVKYGELIKKGSKPKEDKMNISMTFYIDKSGSMAGEDLDNATKLAYGLSDAVESKHKHEKKVIDKFDFKCRHQETIWTLTSFLT